MPNVSISRYSNFHRNSASVQTRNDHVAVRNHGQQYGIFVGTGLQLNAAQFVLGTA